MGGLVWSRLHISALSLLQVLRKKHGYQDQGIKGMFVRRGVVRIKGSDVDGGPIDMDRAEEIAIECDAEV